MKKTLSALFPLALLVSANALAIPEPYWMRVNEYTAILKNTDIKQLIQKTWREEHKGSGFIDSIARKEGERHPSRYEVRSADCRLAVRLSYEVPEHPHPGAGKIELDWDSQLECD